MKLINILKATLVKGPFLVMLKKLTVHFFDKKNSLNKEENLSWLLTHSVNMPEFCKELNANLWDEIQSDVNEMLSTIYGIPIHLIATPTHL